MFCVNCGKRIEDGAAFCPYCGTRQPVYENQPYMNGPNQPIDGNQPVDGNQQYTNGSNRPVKENQPVDGNQPHTNGLNQPVNGNQPCLRGSGRPGVEPAYQQVIPPASVLPEGQEAMPEENNTGLIVLIIILIALIILVGILSFAYLYGFISF